MNLFFFIIFSISISKHFVKHNYCQPLEINNCSTYWWCFRKVWINYKQTSVSTLFMFLVYYINNRVYCKLNKSINTNKMQTNEQCISHFYLLLLLLLFGKFSNPKLASQIIRIFTCSLPPPLLLYYDCYYKSILKL